MPYQGIIFDFNGVLLWDSEWHKETWQAMAIELRGYPLTTQEMLPLMGQSARDWFQYLLKDNFSQERALALALRKEASYRSIAPAHPKEFCLSPGAKDLLDWLVDKNIPRTIATSSEITNLEFYFKHLGLEQWFDRSLIAYDDGKIPCKPDPTLYLRAAQSLKLSPAVCIVIEDAPSGIEAAKKAGIGKIIALGPVETHESLRKIEGVREVIATLDEFNRLDLQ